MEAERLILFSVATVVLTTGVSAASFAGGSGTSSDPYQIDNCVQLQEIWNGSTGSLSDNYELISDIDCSETINWNGGEGFSPIGNASNGDFFEGVINGNGYAVKDLYIHRSESDQVAFIEEAHNAVIRDFYLINVSVTGQYETGGLIGYTEADIDNVGVVGTINGTGGRVGGIAGLQFGGTISNAFFVGNVSGIYNDVGGLVGASRGDVIESYTLGVVDGNNTYVGGLIGNNELGYANDSYSSSLVKTHTTESGGFVGGLGSYAGFGSTNPGYVYDSYWDIEGSNQTIGVGDITAGSADLTGLSTSEMRGDSASSNMVDLDFSNNWSEVLRDDDDSTADGYPILFEPDRELQLKAQGIYTVPNVPPEILSQTLVWRSIGGDVKRHIKYSISDSDGEEIGSHSEFPSGTAESEFTNSTLAGSGWSSPFDYFATVTDFNGAVSAGRELNFTVVTDSGVRADSGHAHSVDDQQLEYKVNISNRGDSANYSLSFSDEGTVVQNGTVSNQEVPSGTYISTEDIWNGDWITGEKESTYDRYEDSSFDHSEDEQVLVNQTELVVDNQRSFQFSSVDLSSICSQTSTADIVSGSNVVATSDCNRPTFTVDFIDQSVGSLFEDGTVAHDLDSQGVSRVKNLTEVGGYSWTGVNVSSPEMPGSCVNCGQREVDVAADSTSSIYYNATGDWVDSTVEVFEKGQHGAADLDQQSFYNQTSLEASNSQSFRFNSVDLSSKCSVTTSGDVPPGSSTVTTACTNSTFSGDWIQNEVNESTRFQEGSVVIGDGVSELYRAGQNVSVENTRSDVNLTVDFSGQLVEEQSCSVVDSVRTVRASTAAEFQFEKLCSPGEVVSHEPVQKTETATDFKHTYRGEFKLYLNLTEEEPITFAVERSRLSNFEERVPTETEVYVNGRGSGLSVDQRYFNDTEYVTVEVPDDFGNSSLHEGSHSVKLVYYESKSPGGTSGGASTGSIVGGSSGVQETVENVTGEYNWTVSAAVASDTQKFTVARAPGDTFEKQILLENTGSSDVPLNISCTSQDNFCHYVDLGVDHVVLNTGSFSQKQVTVSGNIPANASAGSSYTFRILVEDPSSNGLGSDGAATVDFLVTVSDFWGGIISYAGKLTEMRELQPPFGVGSPIPYPFALLPVLSAVVVGGFSWGLRRLLEIEASTKVQILDFALVVFTFLVSVPLWP